MRRVLIKTRSRVYRVRLLLLVAALVAVPLAFKLFGWSTLEDNNVALVAIMVGLMVGLMFFHVACARPLWCPRCRRFLRVSPNTRVERQELYVCRACEVEWDTGVSISDS